MEPEDLIADRDHIWVQWELHLHVPGAVAAPINLRRQEMHAAARVVAGDAALVALAIELAGTAIDWPPEVDRVHACANEHERDDDAQPEASNHGRALGTAASLNTDHGPNVA